MDVGLFRTALSNTGSREFFIDSCCSVTCADAICWLTWSGPADMSVADFGNASGAAWFGFGAPGLPGTESAASGTTSLAFGTGSGVAAVVSAISWPAASLPSPTLPWTAVLTSSALPDSPNLSASSRFFGARSLMAFSTAAMNDCLSNSFG
ncbi:hypothetical protein [Streptomyces antimycoticus]|uniref:hypothetical protein n=1 Tax=Streptomyces antimycoticus TaxID=68175 RepID=UPI000A38DE52|nr:hypothetical protein [Streptomyces antimycoticus]